MKKGKIIRCPEKFIREVLGGLDPDESALVTYEVGDTYLIEFDTVQTFDEFTGPPTEDEIEVIDNPCSVRDCYWWTVAFDVMFSGLFGYKIPENPRSAEFYGKSE